MFVIFPNDYAKELIAGRHRQGDDARLARLTRSSDPATATPPAGRPRRFRRRVPVGLASSR